LICGEENVVLKVLIDGTVREAKSDELLIDVINRSGAPLPQVCYHAQVGPVQTCDTCLVEIDGRLVRACATPVSDGMQIVTKSVKAAAAQIEAFDRILSNHLLYCTVCDNNNGNCTVHNTTKLLAIEHQRIPFKAKPYEVDGTNPFYRYDPSQCILCGRCVEACQNVEVNETLSINWEDPNPRVLWDGGSTIGESSCVSCGHCVTVCPCNALMKKTMLGHAGFLTSLKLSALTGMIDIVKGIEPETGYGSLHRCYNSVKSKVPREIESLKIEADCSACRSMSMYLRLVWVCRIEDTLSQMQARELQMRLNSRRSEPRNEQRPDTRT
jgi:formate dehydrogenase major subunit